jgi:hypothetical protein
MNRQAGHLTRRPAHLVSDELQKAIQTVVIAKYFVAVIVVSIYGY